MGKGSQYSNIDMLAIGVEAVGDIVRILRNKHEKWVKVSTGSRKDMVKVGRCVRVLDI